MFKKSALILILLIVAVNVYSATLWFSTKTIIEDGSGDYTTVKAWEAGEQANLVSTGCVAVGEISNAWTNPEDLGTDDYFRFVRRN